ncbi:MAG: hypothetical protein RIM72_07535 [Alphaproteobacteria bacterium]
MTEIEHPRRVPALVTYLEPFRIIQGPEDSWQCSIEDVNSANWNYVQLHELVGGIDVGLPPPYHLVMSLDGALAIPPIDKLRSDQEAVEFFNRCLAALLLGGVFCNSITLDNLQLGSIIDWKYLRVHSPAHSGINQFHHRIRMKKASPMEAIALYKPRVVTFDTLQNAATVGLGVLSRIPELSAEFLLKGVTGHARRDWGTALSNLWVAVEQLTQHLWTLHVVSQEKDEEHRIPGRKDQLADVRTWTIAARHELLAQKGVVSKLLLSHLANARRARNELAHTGKHPSKRASESAYSSICGLLELCLDGEQLPFLSIDLENHSISDPFSPIDNSSLKPEFWMEIPKLPGEHELELDEAKRRSRER